MSSVSCVAYEISSFLQPFCMMAQPASTVILVAALLINILSYCSTENVYCVTPTASSFSSCPPNSTHCATLSEYAQEAEMYFTSDTTMVFLPGNHVLDTNIKVANVTRLTMCGDSSSGNIATVVRNGSVGFSFTNMVDFNIHSLAFTSYNFWSYGRHLTASSSALFLQSTQNAELVNCSFHDNLGTALMVHNTIITLEGNNFMHNQCGCELFSYNCKLGCGITAFSSNLTFIGNTIFYENNAIHYYGGTGAIWASVSSLDFDGTNNFIGNSAEWYGGAIHVETNSSLSFNGTSNFSHNSADYDGGAIDAYKNTALTFTGTSSFCNNSAMQGGAISANVNTKLTFDGNISFANNTGDSNGGALYLYISSTFSILAHTIVRWENNHASFGGAIYVYDANPRIYCNKYVTKEKCFFQLSGHNLSKGIESIEMQLFFKNNSADAAGSTLYGGAIDNCTLTGLDSYSSGKVFDKLVHIKGDNIISNISSDPFHICPCENNYPDCSKSNSTLSLYPGELYHISAVAVGQRNGIVPAQVRSRINTHRRQPCTQVDQQTNHTCTILNYNLMFSQNISQLELYIDGPCSVDDKLVLSLKNQTCPPGFNMNQEEDSCVCEPRLAQYTNQCNITNGLAEITRESSQHFWVGYDVNQSQELILHPHCPFDYCVHETVVFTINTTDMQCAHNRSGLLCGHCKEGYSLVLGTFQCVDDMQCTINYLAMLIPLALMGVALVFLLFVCKLTVATGTLSGLVFYANIVGVNRTIFLPVESTDALSVFIAWINLDFGIKTCFYNGMTAYSKTWLQFVFPVYIWVLVGLTILVSHLSQRFANLLGNNPISVLATLILLSYAKVLRTVITAVSFTQLDYSDHPRRVWLYDAKIDYLHDKHIPLFLVAAIVFFFLIFPYTLLLLFGQWLQAISHLKLFSWVNSARLKPFMDSYHAPYKPKQRYWPGLLLVLRFVLLLVFALNYQRDPNINLLAILLGAAVLQLWMLVSGGVYKNWCLDALEGSFVLNLIILVGATMYINITNGNNYVQYEENQLAVGYTSVSTALATFIGILVYHIFQQLRHTKLWKKVPKLNMKLGFKKLNTKLSKKLNTKQTEDINLNDLTNDLTESVKFDQLREPLLDDLPKPTHSVV